MFDKVLSYIKKQPETIVVGILTTIVGYILILIVVVYISKDASKSE